MNTTATCMARQKIVLEYIFNTTVQSLFRFLSTSEGLSEWFSAKVTKVDSTHYDFWWGKTVQRAALIRHRQGESVRFQWEEDHDTNFYFEMHITSDELTGVVSLTITDFSTSDDLSDLISIWDNNIKRLKLKIGSK